MSMHQRPPLADYASWLELTWAGDTRELRHGRYLHQQADLAKQFTDSEFWRRLKHDLSAWGDDYRAKTGFALFSSGEAPYDLDLKSWDSFIIRTWRHNIRDNSRYPEPPEQGWLLPDNWFENLWDIVRTRFVVRYLDGVEYLGGRLHELATELGLGARLEIKANDRGYYAVHVVVPQLFTVQSLNYDEMDTRRSEIELQVTTQLQEVIGQLTHHHFERQRESLDVSRESWQWQWRNPEFTPFYLGHIIHYIEGSIMVLRSAADDPADSGPDPAAGTSIGGATDV
ncbi:hypothetical protein AB0F43_21235 [Kribbella sp. NPDC023972]|jgi:hypothetical protein|uniref:hypothetical protein n=1 Tax=Kribbella sp. NPDC023972 TaxID=3154795 RepID=UPI0033D06C14